MYGLLTEYFLGAPDLSRFGNGADEPCIIGSGCGSGITGDGCKGMFPAELADRFNEGTSGLTDGLRTDDGVFIVSYANCLSCCISHRGIGGARLLGGCHAVLSSGLSLLIALPLLAVSVQETSEIGNNHINHLLFCLLFETVKQLHA